MHALQCGEHGGQTNLRTDSGVREHRQAWVLQLSVRSGGRMHLCREGMTAGRQAVLNVP